MKQPTIYVGVGQVKSRDGFMYALEPETGALLWRYLLHGASVSYPVVSSTGIYFSVSNGYVYALNISGDALLWQKQIHHRFPSPPVIADEWIYICTSDAVYAFQAVDGSLRWQLSIHDLVPIRPLVRGDRIYVRLKNGSVSVLQASDGALLRSIQPINRDRPLSLAATQDVVYVAQFNGDLSAQRATDGSLLWQQPLRYNHPTDPIIYNDILYLIASGNVQARQCSDGSLLWSSHSYGLSLAATNNMLFVSDGRNKIGGVSALYTTDGSFAWRWHTSIDQGGVTAPTVAYGAVYMGIGATGGLYAFSANEGRILWHTLDGMSVTSAAC